MPLPDGFFDQVRKQREKSLENMTTRMLIYGLPGCGKTHLATTARRPILFHSFDPGGCNIQPVLRGEKEGWIIVHNFEKEDPRNPKIWLSWEDELNRLFRRAELFKNIGTFVIDSMTTLSQCALYQSQAEDKEFLKRNGHSRAGLRPRRDDWLPTMSKIEGWLRRFATIESDLVIVCHVDEKTKETTAEEVIESYSPLLIGKLRQRIPLLLDEIWYLKSGMGVKISPMIQTFSSANIMAKTIMSSLDPFEKPDIRNILKKGGRIYTDKE